VAKNASVTAEGLCTYVRAMKSYHEASKVVKPKMKALAIAEGQMTEGQMTAATQALFAAEARLAACNERLADLQSMYDAQMRIKRTIEEGGQMRIKRTIEEGG
jgi:dynein heavy chain, axonemal